MDLPQLDDKKGPILKWFRQTGQWSLDLLTKKILKRSKITALHGPFVFRSIERSVSVKVHGDSEQRSIGPVNLRRFESWTFNSWTAKKVQFEVVQARF